MNIKTICLVLALSAAGFAQSAGVTTVVVTYSATPAFTVNAGVTNFEMTLTGNVTSSTFASAAASVGSFKICQDGTGGRTFAWPASFQGFGAIDPTASACSKVSWKWDGTYVCATGPVISDGTGGYVSFNSSGAGKVAGAFSALSFNNSDTAHNGLQYLQGTTSGGLAFSVANIAGTAATVLWPTSTAADAGTSKFLQLGSSVTCPTGLPSAAPATCYQLSWATAGGGGGGTTAANGASFTTPEWNGGGATQQTFYVNTPSGYIFTPAYGITPGKASVRVVTGDATAGKGLTLTVYNAAMTSKLAEFHTTAIGTSGTTVSFTLTGLTLTGGTPYFATLATDSATLALSSWSGGAEQYPGILGMTGSPAQMGRCSNASTGTGASITGPATCGTLAASDANSQYFIRWEQ